MVVVTVPRSETTKKTQKAVDIEIFAGAGGMTLGIQQAGFRFAHLFEIDPHSCRTLEHNTVTNGGVLHGKVHRVDVSEVDWSDFSQPVRLLAGGAPCQPFSLAGRHLADKDDRNMFPEVFRAVRALQPQVVLLENVRGLARQSFRPYLRYIVRQLEWPSITPKKGEEWQDHDLRLCQHQSNRKAKPEYYVVWDLLEAADYGVPQNRKRVFIVATRSNTLDKFEFPAPTHNKGLLIRTQNNGEYWDSCGIKRPKISGVNASCSGGSTALKAWKTVRDAISDLPQAAEREAEAENNHWLVPGARIYRGHSGSSLDWPSKTIKAGVHGVPGGENIVLLGDGNYRYFTLRETARIQGFPDEFIFCGARLHITRQIGNAVPIKLAEAIAQKLFKQIGKSTNRSRQQAHE